MKKYISLLMLLVFVCSIFCSCTVNEKTPQNQLEILESDSEYIQSIKKVNNELEKYLIGDFVLYNFAQIGEEYAESTIIREGAYELEYDIDFDYIVLFMDNYNYIYSDEMGFVKIDDMVNSSFSENTFNSYRKIISWILENEDKFECTKHIDDNNVVSYTYYTTDTEFIKNKYQESFGNYEFLNTYTKSFEFVFSFTASGKLLQIDWFGTDEENANTINMATTFSTDIVTAYNSIGENTKNIWKDAKKYAK